MRPRGVFVTGTDTGVGKTLVSCAWVHAARRAGLRVGAMKPIAAGAASRDGRLANEDTDALLRALGWTPDRAAAVTPILLREPIAPHIAARLEGVEIDLDRVSAAFTRMAGECEYLVVEGVGGFRVPLDDTRDTADLARLLALPVVMVVGMRLGCLNHALLTADAIARTGLAFAGWIASCVEPSMPYRDENIEALRQRLRAPHLGTIPCMDIPDPERASHHLDIAPALAAR